MKKRHRAIVKIDKQYNNFFIVCIKEGFFCSFSRPFHFKNYVALIFAGVIIWVNHFVRVDFSCMSFAADWTWIVFNDEKNVADESAMMDMLLSFQHRVSSQLCKKLLKTQTNKIKFYNYIPFHIPHTVFPFEQKRLKKRLKWCWNRTHIIARKDSWCPLALLS